MSEIVVTLRVQREGSNEIKSFTEDLKGANTAAKDSSNAFTQMGNAVTGMIAAYAGARGLQVIADTVALGESANKAEGTFKALTATMGNYESLMSGLRQASQGVVNDMDLQSGASKLLSMNLVDSQEQMDKFITLATRLGASQGIDAGKSIENLALMVSNQSYLRLDSLGLSASRVRERVKELADEFPNMDKQARFLQATLEQGDLALARLGDSATAAATPLDRLLTDATNRAQDFAQALSTGVNALIGIGQYAAGTLPEQEAMRRQQEAQAQAAEQSRLDRVRAQQSGHEFIASNYGSITGMASQASGLNFAGLNSSDRTDLIAQLTSVYDMIKADPTLAQHRSDLNMFLYRAPEITRGPLVDAIFTQMVEVRRAAFEKFATMQGMGIDDRAGGDFQAPYGMGPEHMARLMGLNIGDRGQGDFDAPWRYDPYRGSAAAYGSRIENGPSDAYNAIIKQQARQSAEGQLGNFMSQGGGVGMFATRETANELAAAFERIKTANEAGLISDDDMNKARSLNDSVQKAADAMEKMSLTDAFGQSSGGMMGQIEDMVIAQMRKDGKTPAEIEAAQKNMDLTSGRGTTASQYFESSVIPGLAGMDSTARAAAMQEAADFLQKAADANLSDPDMQKGLAMLFGMTDGGNQFVVKSGQSVGQVAAQYGMTNAEVLAATGAKNDRLMMPGSYGTAPTMGAGMDVASVLNALIQGAMQKMGGMDGSINPMEDGGMGKLMGKGAGGQAPYDAMDKSLKSGAASGGILSNYLSQSAAAATKSATAMDAVKSAIDGIPNAKSVTIDLSVNDPQGILALLGSGATIGVGAGAAPTIGSNTIQSGGGGRARPSRNAN